MPLFCITETEPSTMHNISPCVLSRPCTNILWIWALAKAKRKVACFAYSTMELCHNIHYEYALIKIEFNNYFPPVTLSFFTRDFYSDLQFQVTKYLLSYIQSNIQKI